MPKILFLVSTILLLQASFAASNQQNLRLLTDVGDIHDEIANKHCLKFIDGNFYSLRNLDKDDDFNYTVYNNDYNGTTDVINYHFKICNYASTKCNEQESFSNEFHNASQTPCTHLTSNSTDKQFTFEEFKYEENKTNVTGLNLTWTGGDLDTVNNVNRSFTLLLECEPNNTNSDELVILNHGYKYDEASGNTQIRARTHAACRVIDFDALVNFVVQHKVVFCIVFIALGLFVTFFGQKLFTISLFIIGFLVTFSVTMLSIFYFIHKGCPAWIQYSIAGLSAVLGILVGFVISRDSAQKIAHAVLGGVLGCVGVMFLFGTFLVSKVDLGQYGNYYYIGALVVGVIAGAILGYVLKDAIQILATSIIGAFVVGYGVLILIKADINQLLQQLKLGQLDHIDSQVLLVFVGMILLAIAGVFTQYHIKKREKDDDKNDMYDKMQTDNGYSMQNAFA